MRVALALPLVLAACAPAVSPPSRPAGRPTPAPQALPTTNRYAITTPEGRLVVRLLDETPQHRDNFKRLVQQGFYDGTWFHRIIAGFVVQGGDPNTRDSTLGPAGEGGPGYTVPAEIGAYHVKGALAAARQRIVRTTGNPSFAWPVAVRALYTSRGGTPQLDGQYTVFGMLEEGFDVLDRLAAAETIRSRTGNGSAPDADRPIRRLVISVRPVGN